MTNPDHQEIARLSHEVERIKAECERLKMELRCEQIRSEDRGNSYAEVVAEIDLLRAVWAAAKAWREGRDRTVVGTAPPGGKRSRTGIMLIDAIDAALAKEPR